MSFVYNTSWGVDKGEGTFSADKLTWTGNASSVRFTATGSTYVDAIEVETAPANAETITPADNEYTTEVSSLADFNALSDGTLVKLNLTDAVITSGMVNEWGCYVQDATAGAHFYCTGLNLKVGNKLNGFVYVKKNKQTMGSRIAMTEETNSNDLTISEGGTYTPATGSIAELSIDGNLMKVIKLTDVAVKGTSATAATITDADSKTININNGKTNYFPYVIQESLADIDYAKATVIGILTKASSGFQIMPLSITEDIETGIQAIDNSQFTIDNSQTWFTIDGRRLSGKPTQKGIYIVNGHKVIVK